DPCGRIRTATDNPPKLLATESPSHSTLANRSPGLRFVILSDLAVRDTWWKWVGVIRSDKRRKAFPQAALCSNRAPGMSRDLAVPQALVEPPGERGGGKGYHARPTPS